MTDLLYFNRHYDRFLHNCNINQLHTHYNIPTKQNERKNIYLQKFHDYCLLYIEYSYSIDTGNDCTFGHLKWKKLPVEIIDIVEAYAKKCIKLVIKIDYQAGFPFAPPEWSLHSLQHNLNSPVDLNEYYEYICSIHNKVGFTYLLGIEGDVAEFISRIDYFDQVVEHC